MALLALAAGVLAGGVAIYLILRALFMTRKNLIAANAEQTSPEKKEKVEFIIDTFSSLIQKLKEKEDELEKLRGMAERRASAAENYNEDILMCVGSGVVTFNMDRVITTFNHAAEKMLSIKKEDAVGLSCVKVFGQDNAICHVLDESLMLATSLSRQEISFQKKEGTNIWIGLSVSPLRDKEGKHTGIIIVFTDLTEIKMLREQGELRQRLAMLGEMSGGIAHELRNSMGSIMGYAKMLSKKFPDEDPSQQDISTIISEVNAMDLIIRELLNYGRNVTPSLSPVDFSGLLRNTIDITMGKYTDHKIDVDLSINDLPTVNIDEVLMRQALQNIIQNGLEAMPNGGRIKISARSHPSEYRNMTKDIQKDLQVSPSVEGIEIIVEDTGIGIPKDTLDKIFLPFYTTKPRGTGMGLALVHKIILSHGGHIDVESETGKGTTFRIYLPCISNNTE
ncbi:MAG: PAS domain-containing protein [Nitrospirae bacterium]|nr:PAS domain-containing protein [Nitrospirota bacterium]